MNCPKTFLKRYKTAKGKREEWSSVLRNTYELFLPNRNAFQDNTGRSSMVDVFDDTGAQSLTEFVNAIKNKICPHGQRWATLQSGGRIQAEIANGNFTVEENDELNLQLSKQTEILFHYIHSSNFDNALIESLSDMSISTGALFIRETNNLDDPFAFTSIPVDQLAIEEGSDGTIKNVYREWCLLGEEIKDTWPEAVLDEELSRHISRNPTAKIKIIEGVVYNYEEGIYDYLVYAEKNCNKFIYKSKYHVSPFVVFRWNKTAGETWGRGPAMGSLPTMKLLNKLVSDLQKNNSMAVNPPAVVNAGAVINPTKVKLIPNSRILVKSDWMGNRSAVEYLQNGSNFNLGIGMRDEARQQIRENFYLHTMGDSTAPVRSATEISIRNSQHLEQQTSAFTRLKSELVDAVIKRCYYILSRLSIVQALEIDGSNIAVKATSELSKVQDLKDLDALTQYFQTLIGLGGEQGLGLAASAINIEKLPRYYANKMGVPAELILGEKEAAEQAMAMQQQMMQAQQIQQQM